MVALQGQWQALQEQAHRTSVSMKPALPSPCRGCMCACIRPLKQHGPIYMSPAGPRKCPEGVSALGRSGSCQEGQQHSRSVTGVQPLSGAHNPTPASGQGNDCPPSCIPEPPNPKCVVSGSRQTGAGCKITCPPLVCCSNISLCLQVWYPPYPKGRVACAVPGRAECWNAYASQT